MSARSKASSPPWRAVAAFGITLLAGASARPGEVRGEPFLDAGMRQLAKGDFATPTSPQVNSGTPTTAASWTVGWVIPARPR